MNATEIYDRYFLKKNHEQKVIFDWGPRGSGRTTFQLISSIAKYDTNFRYMTLNGLKPSLPDEFYSLLISKFNRIVPISFDQSFSLKYMKYLRGTRIVVDHAVWQNLIPESHKLDQFMQIAGPSLVQTREQCIKEINKFLVMGYNVSPPLFKK